MDEFRQIFDLVVGESQKLMTLAITAITLAKAARAFFKKSGQLANAAHG